MLQSLRLIGLVAGLALGIQAQNPQFSVIASGCSLTGQPAKTIVCIDPPVLGGTVRTVPQPVRQADFYAMLTGLTVIPASLAPFGFPTGCWVFPSLEYLIWYNVPYWAGNLTPAPLNGNGGLSIPFDMRLLGVRFYQQAILIGSPISEVSDAAELRIGLPEWPLATPIPGMVPIFAGTFMMGSTLYPNRPESPVHPVTISRPYWIGGYEVTEAEATSVLGYNPSAYLPLPSQSWSQGPNYPVLCSWDTAVTFCRLLTSQEAAAGRISAGYQYRLPTEAEWEYACRAGTTTEYWTGNTVPGWIVINGPIQPIGSSPPNPWGLSDVHGNVAEWCLDRWDSTPNYPAGAVIDPYSRQGDYRIIRGGANGWNPSYMRSASRAHADPTWYGSNLGFRIVLGPALVP